jgi:hypothetical protein
MVVPFMMSSLIAMTAPDPIHIESCSVSTPVTIPQGDAGSLTYGSYSVTIRFVNTAQEPVSRVTFRLNDGKDVVDAGTFSPDVSIDHTLQLPATNADSCTVARVTFSNDMSWSSRRPTRK